IGEREDARVAHVAEHGVGKDVRRHEKDERQDDIKPDSVQRRADFSLRRHSDRVNPVGHAHAAESSFVSKERFFSVMVTNASSRLISRRLNANTTPPWLSTVEEICPR